MFVVQLCSAALTELPVHTVDDNHLETIGNQYTNQINVFVCLQPFCTRVHVGQMFPGNTKFCSAVKSLRV